MSKAIDETLDNELAAIVAEAEAAIDKSDLPVALPAGMKSVLYSVKTDRGIGLIKDDAKDWFRSLIGGLKEKIRETLCCHGYTKIDTKKERKQLAGKLTLAICARVPPKFLPLMWLLEPLIRKAVEAILNWLAKRTGDWCANVKCALSPLAI